VASARKRATARSPAWRSPAQHSSAITIGLPWACSGISGIGGATMMLAIADSSSGAASASATNPSITSGVAGGSSMPPTIVSSGCSR
jgi:uncharacterized metal-binding protein